MIKRTGRPREKEFPDYKGNRLPQKETEEHRQMKEYFFSLPPSERDYMRVAKKFNCSYDKVWSAARQFEWLPNNLGEIVKTEAYDIYRPIIDESVEKFFNLFLEHLNNELMRVGFAAVKLPASVDNKFKSGAVKEATQELLDYIKQDIPVKAKNYKELSDLYEMFCKVSLDLIYGIDHELRSPKKTNEAQPFRLNIEKGIIVQNANAPVDNG